MGFKKTSKIAINLINDATNPAANTTYYFGNNILGMSTGGTYRVIYAARPMVIRAIELFIENTNSPTTEDLDYSIRVNNTTDYTIDTLNFAGGGATQGHVFNRSMNVPLDIGDYFNIKIALAAVFVTPPQGFYHSGYIIAEC